MTTCSPPEFLPEDKVVSLVYHLPEIKPGTRATIVSPWVGPLVAVQLPNGELHRWHASFELEAVNSNACYPQILQPGDLATVLVGHPPHTQVGMTVKVVKVLPSALFYDLILEDGHYHRWLADFELVSAGVVN